MKTESLPLAYIYSTLPVFADEEVLIMSVCASNNDHNKSHIVDKKFMLYATKKGCRSDQPAQPRRFIKNCSLLR